MINEKVKRKLVPTLCYTAEMASEQKMNYEDMSAGNLLMKTCAFPLLGAFDHSGSALRIEKKKTRAIFRTQLAKLPHPPGGSIPPCNQTLKNKYK